jgi:hypothetical protein
MQLYLTLDVDDVQLAALRFHFDPKAQSDSAERLLRTWAENTLTRDLESLCELHMLKTRAVPPRPRREPSEPEPNPARREPSEPRPKRRKPIRPKRRKPSR